jgi:hypothetical protein
LGFLNGKKFLMGTSNINDHGELSLADLALELLEIIVLGTPDDLFLDFEMNPLSQTFQVYCSAWPWTDAWVKQKVFWVFSFFKADFALRLFIWWRIVGVEFVAWSVLHDVSTGIDSGFVFSAGGIDFAVDTGLADEELDSAQLNDLTRLEFVTEVFPVLFFEFSDDEICFLFGLDVAWVGLIRIKSFILIDLFV